MTEASEGDPGRTLRNARILFVLPSLGFGGSERQAFLFARHLAHHEGAKVRLVAFARPGRTAELCESVGIPWELFDLWHKGKGRLAQGADLLRFGLFLRRRHVDVLMPYCMFQNIICALTWRAAGVAACIWNQRDEGRARVERWVERLAVQRIGCFVSNSVHGSRFLTDELGAAPWRVHVVHNGVELPAAVSSRTAWRLRLGIPDSAFVACMVANLHQYKDHATLIAAWRLVVDRLRDQGRAAHLVLAGARADRYDSIVRQVDDLHLSQNVHLVDPTADVAGLLGAADLFVFSSLSEGLPNAVLEAMAAGLAVVATDYPGIREAVGLSGASLLARPEDPADFGERTVEVAMDARLRARAGMEGQERARSHFGVEQMCNGMVQRVLAEWR